MSERFGFLDGDTAHYTLNDGEAAVRMCRENPVIALDIETGSASSSARWGITAVSFGTSTEAHVLDPVTQRAAILDCMEAARTLVLHNSMFDMPILHANGLTRVEHADKVVDTVLLARMASPDERSGRGLGESADRVLGAGYGEFKNSMEAGWRAWSGKKAELLWARMSLRDRLFVSYAGWDVIVTSRLHDVLPGQVREHTAKMGVGDPDYLMAREMAVLRMCLRRSMRGIALDFDAIDALKASLMADVAEGTAELERLGIDMSQGDVLAKKQIVAILDSRGILPSSWPRLKDGTRTTSKDWMEKLDGEPMCLLIRKVAQANAFLTRYLGELLEVSHDGRIHPSLNIGAATTGRMSIGNPPLQQFPPKTRSMLRGDQPLTSMDWSSIEPVVAANLAGDADLLAEFEGGGDLYQPVADAAGVPRSVAKTILLARLYGQGTAELALRLGVTETEAKTIAKQVMDRMPRIAALMGRVRSFGDSHGMVPTLSGRVIPVAKDPRSGGYLGYKATNYLVQGSAYDLLAEALWEMEKQGLGDHLFLPVHDEIVCHTEVADEVQRIMTTPHPALVEEAGRVPVLRVGRSDMDHNWEATK